MKAKRDGSFDESLSIFCAIAGLVGVLLTMSTLQYNNEKRAPLARDYFNKLEAPLAVPINKGHEEIRRDLSSWLSNYTGLQVSGTHEEVYKQVEQLFEEATALGERYPTMLAPDYQNELLNLVGRIQAVPRIGKVVLQEQNPWWRGYPRFIAEMLATVACWVFWFATSVVAAWEIGYLLLCGNTSEPKTETDVDPSSSPTRSASSSSGGTPVFLGERTGCSGGGGGGTFHPLYPPSVPPRDYDRYPPFSSM